MRAPWSNQIAFLCWLVKSAILISALGSVPFARAASDLPPVEGAVNGLMTPGLGADPSAGINDKQTPASFAYDGTRSSVLLPQAVGHGCSWEWALNKPWCTSRSLLGRAPAEVGEATSTTNVGNFRFESDLIATRGTSVLGSYPKYLEKAAELGAKRFNIPTPIWEKMSDAQRWGANQKFLDRLIQRGDEVILTTPIGKISPGTYLEREVNYLLGKGYQAADQGSRMVPGL